MTTLYFGNITLDISPTTLLLPILITGFGLSFVFVPISTAAYGTLRNEQIGNASGLFNLMRNVGGRIGISVAQTLLIRRSAVHQNEIINSVPITGQQFQNSLGASPAGAGRILRSDRTRWSGAGHAVSAAGTAGGAVGVCGRVPLAFSALRSLRRRGVAVQESEAGQGSGRRALRQFANGACISSALHT